MIRPMTMVLQVLYMPGVIALLPAVKGLGRDVEVTAGKTSILTAAIVVIKPFESLSGLL